MAKVNGKAFTAALKQGYAHAEDTFLSSLQAAWQRSLEKAGANAANRFAVTAAADWQPPVEGAALTVAQINTLAASLNREVEPVWLRGVLASVNPALGLVEISWDVKHPVPRRLVEQAGQRTGARLGDAAQFILRDTLARAYDEGLDVRTTAALIQAKLSDAAPWQADMLARSDLNSLANGASTAAATEVGMGYKTWLATLDDKTRPEHADADGQVVALNDTFIVGGEDAAYPGDPQLSDAMAANCRCTVGYADTLGEAEGLIADAGGTIMAGMATKAQRTRRYERRAAHGKQKNEALEALVAAAIPPKSTPTVDRPWDGPANVAKIPNDAGAETLRGMYAFVIPGKDPATKAAYHLPHHEVVNGKAGAANIPGVRNAMGRAAQIKPPLSDADMAGVRAHLQRHLDDFAKSSSNAAVAYDEHFAAETLPAGVKACSLGGNAGYSGGRLCHLHDGTDAGKATAIKKAQADARKMSAQALVASPQPIGFAGTALIEGKVSDDNTLTPRVIMPNSIEWPEMPLSFLAQTQTAEGHDGAEVAGRIDEFARKKGTGRMQNINLSGEFTNEFGINEIAPMVADKTMRYVSADLGATAWAIVNRETFKEIPEADLSLDDLQAGMYALACTSGKMKAVTLLPTQAIEGAMIALTASADEAGIGIESLESEEMFALVASGQWTAPSERVFRVVLPAEVAIAEADALVASGEQWAPPREWFDMPELPGKMPLTITKDGRVYGHLATWDSCHASFLPSCIPPPKSPSNYAYFHVAELDTSEGDTVTVGKLMFSPTDGGHADRRLSATKASQYYDRTGMAGAYGRVTDGAHGIWFAGAINPRLSAEQRAEMRQELRLNPPSGDWRPINGQYELICALAVAVPGFPTPRTEATIVASGDKIELLDAIIASSGVFEPDPQALFVAARMGIADEDVMAERTMRALAARADGMDALAALAE